jgi:hypothetical protein
LLGNFNGSNITLSTNDSIIVVSQPGNNITGDTVIGASFKQTVGGTVVDTANKNNVTNSNLTAAGIVTLTSLQEVSSFNILIINNPTTYQNIDNTSNKTLVSSIVIATINRYNTNNSMTTIIQLFFQVIQTLPTQTTIDEYSCVFYDSTISQWNDDGCSKPTYNPTFDRYECSCSHLTSFALIWLPQTSSSQQGNNTSTVVKLDAQDIASITFQVASIVCFLAIVIHGIIVRILHPQDYVQPKNLLPLISCGITMVLFVFYIALGLTVYTRYAQSNVSNNSSNQGRTIVVENYNGKNLLSDPNARAASPSTTPSPNIPDLCLPKELALAFIVYFLIIFMFCAKTSVGIYNYRHFVLLFPQPNRRNLFITLAISFLIAIICMIIAASVNSNASYDITGIFQGKICWFTAKVIHYFLTIPICLFLAANLIMIFFVAKCMIHHIRDANTDRSRYTRRRNCIIVLLSSCVTQGLGWIFGILISVNPNSADALGWLFVIFNGLEGVWAILLYIVVRNEHMEDTPRANDDRERRRADREDYRPAIVNRNRRHSDQNEALRNLASDSPRNSFTDLNAIQLVHRPNRNEDDNRY